MTTLAEDLRELRLRKDAAEAEGAEKKFADVKFKEWQAHCLNRMEAEEAESFRTTGYLYSINKRVKGQIEDRRPYVRWALENDEGIQEFLDEMEDAVVSQHESIDDVVADLRSSFYDAIMNTSQVSYKEDGHVINQQARAHVDDEAPLPPGLTFRPDPYIGMTKS
jgi:cytoplasmic iron level regulating protein YaaA (DUF328/UPF0246 family)